MRCPGRIRTCDHRHRRADPLCGHRRSGQETKTTTAAAPTSAAPAGIGDGTYIVGTDIKPGLYKTTGPSGDGVLPDCYWERVRDLSGGMDSIIANDNVKGPTTVQISSSGKAFKTSGCAPWVKIG